MTDNHPQFPLFIPSKGRAGNRMTMRILDSIGVQYRVVVEEQEYDTYAQHIPEEKLLVLDPKYQEKYDTCDGLGDTRSKGSGPARNFIWDLAASEGHKWHWIMDDNISGFRRFNHNLQIPCGNGAFFVAMEAFCLRYVNVAMAGPNYFAFVPTKWPRVPYLYNTRIYSCNLIRTDMPYRWRGRYNEDTDLSLRILKDDWCTILFNAFLQVKMVTQTVPGGNTEALYGDGTVAKSKMIVKLHPDVARLTWRYGRCHHMINYRPFKNNKLRRRKGLTVEPGVNNFGMALRQKSAPARGQG